MTPDRGDGTRVRDYPEGRRRIREELARFYSTAERELAGDDGPASVEVGEQHLDAAGRRSTP